jgi:hypothetical protein
MTENVDIIEELSSLTSELSSSCESSAPQITFKMSHDLTRMLHGNNKNNGSFGKSNNKYQPKKRMS